MEYVIVAALVYFSYQYISDLVAVYKSGAGFGRTEWLLAALCVAMIVFAVLYIIRIIKKFKNKEQREKEKAEREQKLREKELEERKKRAAQYLPDYDDVDLVDRAPEPDEQEELDLEPEDQTEPDSESKEPDSQPEDQSPDGSAD